MATDQRILDGGDVHRRAQHGDEQAIASLYRTHFPKLVRLCATRVRDDAEDVAQEAMLVGLAALGRLDDAVAFWRYVRRVALNECADRRRPGPRFVELDEGLAPTTALGSTVEHDEHVAAIRAAAARLSASERAVLALSATDYAETYGVSLANARQLRHRARARFARLYAAVEARFVAIPVVRGVAMRCSRTLRRLIATPIWEQGAAVFIAAAALSGVADRAVFAPSHDRSHASIARPLADTAGNVTGAGTSAPQRGPTHETPSDAARVREDPPLRWPFGTAPAEYAASEARQMDVFVAAGPFLVGADPCALLLCVLGMQPAVRYVAPGAAADPAEPLSISLR